jgi:photosystem II stability/assembly factor-like uncharacterized protein
MRSLVFYLIAFMFSSAYSQDWAPIAGPKIGDSEVLEIGTLGEQYTIIDKKLYIHESSQGQWRTSSWLTAPPQHGLTFAADLNGACYIGHASTKSIFERGIYRSTDKGITWTQVHQQHGVYRFKQSDNGHLFAVSNNLAAQAILLRSTNNGLHWDSLTSLPFKVVDFVVTKNNQCYLSVQDDSAILVYTIPTGLFRTIKPPQKTNIAIGANIILCNGLPLLKYDYLMYALNAQDSFQQLNTPGVTVNSKVNPMLINKQNRVYVQCRPFGDNSYILTYSDDRGITWKSFESVPPYERKEKCTIALDSSGVFYCSTDLGIYKTTDLGKNWEVIGPAARRLSLLQPGPGYSLFARDSLYEINTSGGIRQRLISYLSTDEGKSWLTNPPYLPNHLVGRFGFDKDRIPYYFDVDDSSNSFSVWRANDFFPTSYEKRGEAVQFLPSFVGESRNRLYGYDNAGKRAFYSEDKGSNWTELVAPPDSTYFDCFGISLSDDLYAGYSPSSSRGPALYKSSNRGLSWSMVSIYLPSGGPTSTINSIRFPALNTIIIGTGGSGIWQSTDNGKYWYRWDPQLFDSVTCIEIVNNTCFVGTTTGLFSCMIGTDTWKEELFTQEKASVLQVTSLYNAAVFVSIDGHGLWTKEFGTRKVENETTQECSITAMTDLTGGDIQLNLWLPQRVECSVKIYNVTGNCLRTLCSTVLASGDHSFSIPSETLSNGSYFAVLTTDHGEKTASFVVVR